MVSQASNSAMIKVPYDAFWGDKIATIKDGSQATRLSLALFTTSVPTRAKFVKRSDNQNLNVQVNSHSHRGTREGGMHGPPHLGFS